MVLLSWSGAGCGDVRWQWSGDDDDGLWCVVVELCGVDLVGVEVVLGMARGSDDGGGRRLVWWLRCGDIGSGGERVVDLGAWRCVV
ncbi:hypothetical protein Tco_0079124 [Tanacetum coccineum]